MSRYIRNTVIQFKAESVYGTDPAGYTPTDAVLVRNPKFKIDRDVVPRELVRSYLGGSENLIGTRRAEIEFDVEFTGSGAAGTAPAWGTLLRACGMAQAIFAGNRVEYTPVSAAFESLTMRFHYDGVRYTARGCRGTVMLKMDAYGIPYLSFKFWGFDTVAVAAIVPATDFTAWKKPPVLSDAVTADIRLGGTYATGTITGGTTYPSQGLNIDLAQKLSHLKLLGGESIDIVDRDTSGSMTLFLTAAQEITWRDEVNANTLSSLSFSYGTVAGAKIAVFAPAVQRINPESAEYEGRLMMKSELRFLPSSTSGNDELRIVAL